MFCSPWRPGPLACDCAGNNGQLSRATYYSISTCLLLHLETTTFSYTNQRSDSQTTFQISSKQYITAWRLFRQYIDAPCSVSALITIHQAISRGMITIRTRQQEQQQQLTTYQGLSLGICIDSLFSKCSPNR